MKRIAILYLVSGLLIIASALGVAVSATTIPYPTHIPQMTGDTCTFCHLDLHPEIQTNDPTMWTLVTAAAPSGNEPGSAAVPMCTSCHTTDEPAILPTAQIQDQIDTVQDRITVLERDLANIYTLYPNWDSTLYRFEKSEEQVLAEQIGTLLAVLQADGSWGFHDSAYTEQMLSDAENLMETLQQNAGL